MESEIEMIRYTDNKSWKLYQFTNARWVKNNSMTLFDQPEKDTTSKSRCVNCGAIKRIIDNCEYCGT